jgi:hypothetical protein
MTFLDLFDLLTGTESLCTTGYILYPFGVATALTVSVTVMRRDGGVTT